MGLIGTIVGLIGTFKSLGHVPADQKQALLSKGISEAMNNTAFGLGIAVTCIIFHLFLTAYAKRMIETVELNAMKLENLLSRRQAGEDVGDGLRERLLRVKEPDRPPGVSGLMRIVNGVPTSPNGRFGRRRTRRRASSTSSRTSTSS